MENPLLIGILADQITVLMDCADGLHSLPSPIHRQYPLIDRCCSQLNIITKNLIEARNSLIYSLPIP